MVVLEGLTFLMSELPLYGVRDSASEEATDVTRRS